jgi:hypothetical protein
MLADANSSGNYQTNSRYCFILLIHKSSHARGGAHRHHNVERELRHAEDNFASAEQRTPGPEFADDVAGGGHVTPILPCREETGARNRFVLD